MLSSVTSLVATLRWAHCDRVDYARLAAEQVEVFARHCDTMLAADRAGVIPAGQLAHVRFADFVADEVTAIRRALADIGLGLAADHEAAVRRHLGEHPRGRLGGHRHGAGDLGVVLGVLDERFADYREHFGIERELR